MNKSSIGTILALSLLAISKKGSKSNSEWSPQERNKIDISIGLNLEFLIDVESPRGTIEIIKERVEHAIQIFSKLIENPNDVDPMVEENHIPFRDYPQTTEYQRNFEHSFINIEPQLFDEKHHNKPNTTVGEIKWWYENIEYDEDSYIPDAAEDETPYDRIKIEWDARIPIEIHYLPKRLKEIIDSEVWAEEFSIEIANILENIIKDYFGPYYLNSVGCSAEVDLSEYIEPDSWTRELERREPQTLNGLGLPWNTRTPLWHATVAYNKIMFSDRRFKTKQQLANQQIKNALGGSVGENQLSTTLDFRVACAVAIGLNTVRKIAQKEITIKELYKFCLEHEIYEEVKHMTCGICSIFKSAKDIEYFFNEKYKYDDFDRTALSLLNSGKIKDISELYSYINNEPNIEVIPPSEFGGRWNGIYSTPQFMGFIPNKYTNEDRIIWDTFYFYRAILKARKFYDPLFFQTDPNQFKDLHEQDIGIICSLSSIKRLMPESWCDIYRFGFVRNESLARDTGESLNITGYYQEQKRINYKSAARYIFEKSDMVAQYRIDETPYTLTSDNTMFAVNSMSEIRANPLKLKFVTRHNSDQMNINWGVFPNTYSMNITEISFNNQPIKDMIAFPFFPDNDKEVLWPFNLNEKPKD